MWRTLVLLAACAVAAPAWAQLSPAPTAYGSVQYSYLQFRAHDGMYSGESGSGVTLRVGVRPFSRPRLLAEGAVTYLPENDDQYDAHPTHWSLNLGAMYTVRPLGTPKVPINPFATLSVGVSSYERPGGTHPQCLFEAGCMSESSPLRGTRPTMALGGGFWFETVAGLALRLDLQVHHRFWADGSEAAFSPEVSAGAGYHF